MKLRNFLKLFSASALTLVTLFSGSALAADDIAVRVDNKTLKFDQSPTIYNGRTLVPLRAVFEAVGADVSWEQDTQTAFLNKDGISVSVKLGQPYITRNSVPIAIDCPSQLINGRTMIPVRAVAEAMDFGVTWNPIYKTVYISTSGDEYRGSSQWKTGFLPLSEYGFYIDSAFSGLEYDLDGNRPDEIIDFVPSSDGNAALGIGGNDFSELIKEHCPAPVAFGIVDVIKSDDYKEILIVDGSNPTLSAYFFRYEEDTLSLLELAQDNKKGIDFNEKLFFDGIDNIISDLDGLCFLDTMVCPGIYTLEQNEIKRYYFDCKNSIAKTYAPKHSDDITYNVYYTSSYISGKYIKNPLISAKVMTPADFPKSMTILDMYMDSANPSNFEFFVEFSDGQTAVIYPCSF